MCLYSSKQEINNSNNPAINTPEMRATVFIIFTVYYYCCCCFFFHYYEFETIRHSLGYSYYSVPMANTKIQYIISQLCISYSLDSSVYIPYRDQIYFSSGAAFEDAQITPLALSCIK